MAKQGSGFARMRAMLRAEWPFATLCMLLVAVFLMGGGARADILSLVILRPLAVVCLAIGLFGLTREHWRQHRMPLGIMAAILALIAIHLVPLPPMVWQNLPGRGIAVEAGELVGLEGLWRPLTLVPYRAWNSFYAMLVPAAVMVLAVQIAPERHRNVFLLLVAIAALAVLIGIAQAATSFHPSLYLYRVANFDRPTGLFANRNHFAALLCIFVPMLMLLASRASGSRKLLTWALCIGAALAAFLLIFAVGSRTGLGLSAVGLLVAWAIWRGRPGSKVRRRVKTSRIVPIAALAGIIVAVVLLAVIFDQAEALDRLASTDAAEENRFAVWRVVAAHLGTYMPVGSGIGSFVEIFKIHEPAELLGFNYWNHVHNDWLEWVLEGGIPAALLAVAAVFLWGFRVRNLAGKLHAGRFAIQLGVLGAGIILILGLWSLVDYPLRVPSLACLAALAAVWMTLPVPAGERGGKR